MQRSLKSRALQLLAQRDQSRLELRRKLLRHARADERARPGIPGRRGRDAEAVAANPDGGAASGAHPDADRVEAAATAAAEVDALLDWLEANRFLSNERFAESRAHARAARFGLLRIRNELAQHGVALPPELEHGLAASELERAAAVRERRFTRPPDDAAQRAAQSRFLLARGFSGDVVQRLMRRLGRGRGAGDGAASAED
jgi:regulatory protein